MNKRVYLLAFLVMLLTSIQAFSQEVSFSASAPTVVGVGQQFAITYTLNQEPENVKVPSLKDFDFLGGPSRMIQVVGRNSQQSVSASYTYYFRAKTEGTFTVPAANCQVDGKTYQSNTLTIRVDKSAPAPQPQPQSQYQSQQYSSRQQQQPTSVDENSVFVRAIPSKSTAVQGEQIIVTYKIYAAIPISQYQISKQPSNKGFWAEELDDKNQNGVKQTTENYNGRSYAVAEIRKVAVFGQESGTLRIDPLEMDVIAQIQSNRRTGSLFDLFDDPFFNPVQSVKKTLKSNPVLITIVPLQSKPDNFSGAVGTFEQKVSIDRKELKANEACTYKVTLSGKGNIMLVDKPTVTFPQGIEVYDPKTESSIHKNTAGVSGSKSFEWILIPRSEGKYTIPALKFSYYDIASKRFVEQTSEEIILTVGKGDPNAAAVLSSSNKEDVKLLNSDIDYIKTGSFTLYPKGQYFFKSTLFWILFCLPVIISFLIIFIVKQRQKSSKNVTATRLKKANSVAIKRLKAAEKLFAERNADGFYIEISQALWGYLSDKFNISLANLSMDTIQTSLEHKNLNPEIISAMISTLNDCEYARFAPGDATENMDKLYKEAIEIITKIEQELKA